MDGDHPVFFIVASDEYQMPANLGFGRGVVVADVGVNRSDQELVL